MSLLGFDAIGRLALAQLPLRIRIMPPPSQTDLDQGGTFRQLQRIYLGPSLGWILAPQEAMFPIVATGNYPISRGINLITINVNANVTINLPSAKAGLPGSLPGQWFLMPITIVDIGGFAPGNSYIINPFGTELISGLASIQLSSSFGAFLLKPILETGGWTLLQ